VSLRRSFRCTCLVLSVAIAVAVIVFIVILNQRPVIVGDSHAVSDDDGRVLSTLLDCAESGGVLRIHLPDGSGFEACCAGPTQQGGSLELRFAGVLFAVRQSQLLIFIIQESSAMPSVGRYRTAPNLSAAAWDTALAGTAYYTAVRPMAVMPQWLVFPFLTLVVTPAVVGLWRSLRRGARRRSGRCVQCGYLLTGLPEPRCPECGQVYDPGHLGDIAPVSRGQDSE